MENVGLYQDIAKRTDGDIYIGVVGPVRTGKSTFIKKFMDLLVIPNMDNIYQAERTRDELPQSAAGRTIMTTEPKFIPNEAAEISMGDNAHLKVRMIDCVGYIVDSSLGYYEENEPRGEFVLVIEGKSRQELKQEEVAKWEEMRIEEHMDYYLQQGIDKKEAMKMVAKDRGITKRDVYQQLLG